MDHNNIAILLLSGADMVGALILHLRERRRMQRERAQVFERLAAVERLAADAAAETVRADAVAASLWLYIEPQITNVYGKAVRIFGKATVDRNMREAVECGEWKMPARSN